MKRALSFVLSLLLMAGMTTHTLVAAAPAPVKAIHAATYHIHFGTLLEDRTCSATAIAPAALLTASHCELGTDALDIQGLRHSVKVLGRIRDGNDHTILLVQGVTFEHYAAFADKQPDVGDDVYMWGNPGELTDVFRQGTYSGVDRPRGIEAMFGAPSLNLYNITSFPGDSGAAILNAEGKIIEVLSVGITQTHEKASATFAGGFSLGFTKKQLASAAAYVAPPVSKTDVAGDDDDGPGK